MKIYSKPKIIIALGIWSILLLAAIFAYASLTYPSFESLVKSLPFYVYFIGSSAFIFGLVLLVSGITDRTRWGETPRNLFFLSMIFICIGLYLVPSIFNEAGFVTLGLIIFILVPISAILLLVALIGYFRNKTNVGI